MVILALGLLPANAVRDRMQEGRKRLEDGKTALLQGDAPAAEAKFAAAEDAFLRARAEAGNPLLGFAGLLPLIGRTPDAARGLAAAGAEIARAGRAIASGIDGLPDGLTSLGPREGRIPVESFRSLAPSLASASEHLRSAQADVAGIATSWLLGPVAEARVQLDTQLRPLADSLQAAAKIVDRFPAFLGADGTRRYLFAAENPAELRGTGGLVGAVALMTVRDGAISFGPFEANENFPELPAGRVEPPNPDYARRYPGAAGFMLVANLTPDFPSAAVALERLYEASRGVHVDGVIAADPFALQAMLAISGSVDVPVLGTVTAGNVVPLVTNRAYSLIPGASPRNQVIGQVAGAVLARFLRGAPAAKAATALARAGSGGHIRIHTLDADLESGLALARSDGALPKSGGDVIEPIVNNGGANKIDFYAHRSVDYRVQLGAEHVARADLHMTIQNTAPDHGQPVYVIGPNRISKRGENFSLVSLYLPERAELLDYRENGTSTGTGVDHELGYQVLSTTVSIPSGRTATLDYALGISSAWQGSVAHGTYRLTFLGQTTIQPTHVRIEIRAPAGTRIVHANVPMRIGGDRAVWEGDASAVTTLEIEFQKPVLARAWDALTSFFGKRLFSL